MATGFGIFFTELTGRKAGKTEQVQRYVLPGTSASALGLGAREVCVEKWVP